MQISRRSKLLDTAKLPKPNVITAQLESYALEVVLIQFAKLILILTHISSSASQPKHRAILNPSFALTTQLANSCLLYESPKMRNAGAIDDQDGSNDDFCQIYLSENCASCELENLSCPRVPHKQISDQVDEASFQLCRPRHFYQNVLFGTVVYLIF